MIKETLLALVERLREAGQRRYHLTVEDDPFYSCPKSPDGCADDSQPKDVCNCGADKHNAAVDAAAKALVAKIGEGASVLTRMSEWENLSDEGLRLRCGELTAQEIRTIRAVLGAIGGTP